MTFISFLILSFNYFPCFLVNITNVVLFILFFSLRNICPVLFSLVSFLKRIILLSNTLNCKQYKSELYLFNYYIGSNFEKTSYGFHYYHTRHKHYRSGNCKNKFTWKYQNFTIDKNKSTGKKNLAKITLRKIYCL